MMLKATLERREFADALALLARIGEKRTTIPILSHVLLETNGRVTLAATDQEVSAHVTLDSARAEGEGAATADLATLTKILKGLPAAEAVKLLELENHWLTVTGGRSSYKVIGLDPADFPMLAATPADGPSVTLDGAVLHRLLERVAFAVHKDQTRLNLSGVYVETVRPDGEHGDSELVLTGTDGHRLATIAYPLPPDTCFPALIWPMKFVREVLHLTARKTCGPVTLTIKPPKKDQTSGIVSVRAGAVLLTARTIEGEFPDYHQVIPAGERWRAAVNVVELRAALERVTLLASERTHGVSIEVTPGTMAFSSVNPDKGEASDSIDAAYDGPPILAGYNAAYLLDGLDAADNAEVIMDWPPNTKKSPDEASVGPLCMRDGDALQTGRPVPMALGAARWLYVTMPMRL